MAFIPLRKTSAEISALPIRDGQLIFETNKGNDGKILFDNVDERIVLGGNGTLPTRTGTFLSDEWGDTAPYTQTISVNGISEFSIPIPSLNVDLLTTDSERKNAMKSYGYVWYFDSGENEITATCKFQKPDSDFTIDFRG